MTTEEKLNKARIALVLGHPFFASLLLQRLPLHEDTSCPTAYTDGSCIGYNPEFVDSLTFDQTVGLLVHEVMHVALLHPYREGGRNHGKWNRAADYTINEQITTDGFSLPEGALLDPQYRDMMAEHIYTILEDCDEDNGDPGGCGEVRKAEGTPDEVREQEAETKVAIQQAAQAAKVQGKLPAGLARMVSDAVAPKVNWKDALQQFVADIAKEDYSWQRRNKRYAGDIMLPALYSETLPPIVVAVDTSGSVSDEDLAQFAAEIQAIQSQWDVRIDVVYCDTDIAGTDSFAKGEQIALSMKGGGGTDFAPVMDHVVSLEETPTCLIYFTDLCCSSFGQDPGVPVMWLHHCQGPEWRHWAHEPPFGVVVPMEV